MLTQEQPLFSSAKDPAGKDGQCEDLAKLSLLTEDILLEQLKQRYERDLIYVSSADNEILPSLDFTDFCRLTLEISLLLSILSIKPVCTLHR